MEKEELLSDLERVLPPIMGFAGPKEGKPLENTVAELPRVTDHKYPSAAQIYKPCKMKTSIDRLWRTNATRIYALFLALKNGWLENEQDSAAAQATSPIVDIMFKSVRKLQCVDFPSLSEPRLDFASQKETDHSRVILLSACAVYYDLDFGIMVWFLQRE